MKHNYTAVEFVNVYGEAKAHDCVNRGQKLAEQLNTDLTNLFYTPSTGLFFMNVGDFSLSDLVYALNGDLTVETEFSEYYYRYVTDDYNKPQYEHALWAWQEQQRKIDELLVELKESHTRQQKLLSELQDKLRNEN